MCREIPPAFSFNELRRRFFRSDVITFYYNNYQHKKDRLSMNTRLIRAYFFHSYL